MVIDIDFEAVIPGRFRRVWRANRKGPAVQFLRLILASTLVLIGCDDTTKPTKQGVKSRPVLTKEASVNIHSWYLTPFAPLPQIMTAKGSPPPTRQQIALGKQLFFDARLSKNHDVSCNSCHELDNYGVDGKKFSEGHRKQLGGRNSPSVYNAASQIAQFWDGRAVDVEAQALIPVLNPIEMALPDARVVTAMLASIPGYVTAFSEAFAGENPTLSFENFGKAVGAFERTLTTPAPWDAYLKGDKQALTNRQKRGFNLFVETGCGTCHNRDTVGGTLFKKLGEKEAWPELTDKGRSEVSHNEADAFFFKVPSLRNVAKTKPYLHDGSVTSLGAMVMLMSRHQLGKKLEHEQVQDIVAWLTSLTGELPDNAAKAPRLPESGPTTPKPDPS